MTDVIVDRPHVFVAGQWMRPVGTSPVEVVEASTGRTMARVAVASRSDLDRAAASAREALAGWAARGRAGRAELLDALAAELLARRRIVSETVSRENGMPISLSKVVNGIGPAVITRYYADLVRDDDGIDVRPGRDGMRSIVQREPVGVVAAITPWNYPQALALMKIAPALAAGCTVLLKPSPETALDALEIAAAAEAAGLPRGVLSVLPGGRDLGESVVSHPGVDKVAFTGSTAAGRSIGATCGALLRPVTLELGGKSAGIVLDDADLDVVAGRLLEVCLPNNGQTCHASTRILAPRSRFDEVVDMVTTTVGALVVGDAMDPATEIGPLVSAAQRDRVLGHVEAARAAGARVTTGGGRPPRLDRGWFVEPTVFVGVDPQMAIAQEEVFGPVLVVMPYDDDDDAVAIANDSRMGLAGMVWTSDEERGIALASRVETGSIGVNHYELDPAAPFGGVKDSGLGRELGPEGLRAYETLRTVYLPPPS